MATKRSLSIYCLVLALLCLIVLAYQAWQIKQALDFNHALLAKQYAQAAQHRSAQGRFAHAYAMHSEQQYQQALNLYASFLDNDFLDSDDVSDDLSSAALFNMGNIYLQQAEQVAAEDADLAFPLVELAKQNYRNVLSRNSAHWAAKYNLERALQRFPDPYEYAIQEWQAPERSPRALVNMKADRQLP